MTILFETIHGSHLYNLATPDSDVDIFRVVDAKMRKPKHNVGEEDVTVVDLPTFLDYAGRGVPQFLEAMFAPTPSIDLIAEVRAAFRPNIWLTHAVYRRTARAFVDGDRTVRRLAPEQSFKRQRHAYRLALNFAELAERGRFSPTLTEWQRGLIRLDMEQGADPVALMDAALFTRSGR